MSSLDTGSIGLRLFRSAVASLSLPALQVLADAASHTPAGPLAECYPLCWARGGGRWHAPTCARRRGRASLPIQLIGLEAKAPTLTVPDR